MLLACGPILLLSLAGAWALPVYWGAGAASRGAWGELATAVILEVAVVGLLLCGVLALGSGGRWVTFDRQRRLLTVKRRPFGWRREPRIVESRSLDEVMEVQLLFGGVAEELLVQSPEERSPPITRPYDWYQLNVPKYFSPDASPMRSTA